MMAKKVRFLLISLLLLIIGVTGIVWLYPRTHPNAGLKIEMERSRLSQRIDSLLKTLQVNVPAPYEKKVRIRKDRPLLRYLQERYGIGETNRLVRKALPSYYYEVVWLRPRPLTFSGDSLANFSESGNAFIENLELKFNLKGELIALRRNIADSLRIYSLSKQEARVKALTFLNRFTPYRDLIPDTALKDFERKEQSWALSVGEEGKETQSEADKQTIERVDFHFKWRVTLAAFKEEGAIYVDIVGNRVAGYGFDIPHPDYRDNTLSVIFKIVISVFLIAIIGIMAIRKGLQRLRSYEMGFRLALSGGVFMAILAVTELLAAFRYLQPLEMILALIFLPLFQGGVFIPLWAVAESLGREVYDRKFQAIDLLSNGYLTHSVTGKSVIKGVAYGTAALAVWMLLVRLGDLLGFNLQLLYTEYQELQPINADYPLIHLLSDKLSYSLYIATAALLLVLSIFRVKNKNIYWGSALSAVSIALIYSGRAIPLGNSLLIWLSLGILFVLLFRFNDLLTLILAVFAFNVIDEGWMFFLAGTEFLAVQGWYLCGIISILLFYGLYAYLSKDPMVSFERIRPNFERFINERERLQRELEIARRVQNDFLPKQMPNVAGLEIAARCTPAMEVGGDYFDFFPDSRGRLAAAIGDVSGKGTQAAFYMTLVKGILQALSRNDYSTSTVLKKLNALIFENVQSDIFISMVYALCDPKLNKLVLARAGHNPPLLLRHKDRSLMELEESGIALGLDSGPVFDRYIKEARLKVQKGDNLILYTDGLTEARNKNDEEFGEHRLKTVVQQHSTLSAERIVEEIFEAIRMFTKGKKQYDDMSLVVIKFAQEYNMQKI